jgi:signal transduction histidine kinase
MAQVVESALTRLQPIIETSQAEIILPAHWPAAYGYSAWVEEIWGNYLSNALKYGGEPPRLELGAEETGEMVRFWVKDNGRGISPEQQAKLFIEFSRLPQHQQLYGHGLGLSIVARIAHKLGGLVGVESKVGQGSLFYFTLPKNMK